MITMTSKNKFVWNLIQLVCWLIFAGLCVQAGTLVFNYVYSLFRPIAAYNLDSGLNLAALYNRSIALYSLLFSFLIGIAVLKAVTFYYVLRLFKVIKLVNPFTEEISKLLLKITYQACSVGALCFLAQRFTQQLSHRGFDLQLVSRYWNDSAAYLMMSAILFVVALIFRKGIELQQDNDLTV